MAVEHARICEACERECPDWANRCPACGNLALVIRITVIPAARPLATAAAAKPGRKRASRTALPSDREPPHPHGTSARSTA
ncbi:MAG: hypothetical protein ACRET2_08215 [Steroidobacteraceae bacterium]